MINNYTTLNKEQMMAYLDRMGLHEYASELPKPDKALLDRIVLSHQRNVPFENWTLLSGGEVSLKMEDLYEKIVVKRQGGYCFEMNGLLICLLRGLGYDAFSCLCRVQMGREEVGPTYHRGSIVNIEGKRYFCDVGYGGAMPGGALLIEEGLHQTIDGMEFWPCYEEGGWWKLMRISEGDGSEAPKPMVELMFCEAMADPVDFEAPNIMVSSRPDAPFKMFAMINMKTEHGYKAVNGMAESRKFEFKEKCDGDVRTLELNGLDEVKDILVKEFGFAE